MVVVGKDSEPVLANFSKFQMRGFAQFNICQDPTFIYYYSLFNLPRFYSSFLCSFLVLYSHSFDELFRGHRFGPFKIHHLNCSNAHFQSDAPTYKVLQCTFPKKSILKCLYFAQAHLTLRAAVS